MACQEVLVKFLEDHNRPFSANDIQSSLKGDFGKSAVQKGLEFLVRKEKVKEKCYGKQKVYYIVQHKNETAGNLKEQLLEIDREINNTTIPLKELQNEYKQKLKLVAEIKGKVSYSSTLYQKVNLEREIEDTKEKLKAYADTKVICPTTKNTVQKEYETYLKELKKRRRIGMDILDAILENYPKTKKELYEEIGIETDQNVGFSMDHYQ